MVLEGGIQKLEEFGKEIKQVKTTSSCKVETEKTAVENKQVTLLQEELAKEHRRKGELDKRLHLVENTLPIKKPKDDDNKHGHALSKNLTAIFNRLLQEQRALSDNTRESLKKKLSDLRRTISIVEDFKKRQRLISKSL